ncbi:MAG: c-type cytochrome [Armatimonadota bacterium]|nr:c-type cytochrome [Armatimonadota bacterium]MDR7533599.1 c-type cytochrome [Armatimonadota bacterium]MDR7537398.1 c-type cytochrome [Armatimonadota bacterium]
MPRRYAALVLAVLGPLATFAPGWDPHRVAAGGPLVIAQTEQVTRGREIFAMQCSRCHGDQGQGTDDGPRLIGPNTGLRGYQTAQKLFEFVSTEMPASAPGSLQAQEYWDVLSFLLDANRLLPPGSTLGPENAPNIRLDQ